MAARPVESKGGGSGPGSLNESTRLLQPGVAGGVLPMTVTINLPPGPLIVSSDDNNPVESITYMGLRGLGMFLVLNMIGLAAVLMRVQGVVVPSKLGGIATFFNSYWIVFAPIWAADVYAFAVHSAILAKVCRLRACTADEKRNMARIAPQEVSRTISMEMLPLVKGIILTIIVTLPALVLLTITEVLICSYLQHGSPSPASALAPFVVLEALAVLYSALMKTGSHKRTLGWFLLLLSTITLALRASRIGPFRSPSAQRGSHLWVAFVPMWILQAYLTALLVLILLRGAVTKRYRLSVRHGVCLALFGFSMALITLAELMLCWRYLGQEIEDAITPHLHSTSLIITDICAIVGFGLCALALYLVAEDEVDHVITTHGYVDPLPLSRTGQGWGPTGAKTSFWLLMGRIEEEAPATGRLRGKGGKAGRAAGGTGQESPTWARSTQQELFRSNSGSYANLEEDL